MATVLPSPTPRALRAASFMANRFRATPPGERVMLANAFFEYLGLVGGFIAVAWYDLRTHASRRTS
ncbi:DoxX family protein [Pandoraea communis]|uniref:DoxX family protein n=1 Tax=Pandoraea communis TaxID=2508297 RepID=A0A5E4Z562_9BURK|nr:DoxX family protein [Pandoraea communis]